MEPSSTGAESVQKNDRNGQVGPPFTKESKQSRFTINLPRGTERHDPAYKSNDGHSCSVNQFSKAKATEPALSLGSKLNSNGRCNTSQAEILAQGRLKHGQTAPSQLLIRTNPTTLNTRKSPAKQSMPVTGYTDRQHQRKNNHLTAIKPNKINTNEVLSSQIQFLKLSLQEELPALQMKQSEIEEKGAFSLRLTQICENTIKKSNGLLSPVDLVCFGSLSSGLANADSDMDIAIVPRIAPSVSQITLTKHGLPRVLEDALLSEGVGARLLTKTRVPILKLCESPTPELLAALKKARREWEDLSEEDANIASTLNSGQSVTVAKAIGSTKSIFSNDDFPSLSRASESMKSRSKTEEQKESCKNKDVSTAEKALVTTEGKQNKRKGSLREERTRNRLRPREKRLNSLDFPRSGVGTQCDINFSNPLALQNSVLLRCYSLCDSRVKPMVQYIKGWAKRRKINSSYSGTLSSYGYVLMVLHFLINISNPPVLPNLQLTEMGVNESIIVERYKISFWRDERQIHTMAAQGRLTNNCEPLEFLLRNFFQYYAATGPEVIKYGFSWFHDVISLRTRGGLMPKKQKGWVGAKTSTTKDHVRTQLSKIVKDRCIPKTY